MDVSLVRFSCENAGQECGKVKDAKTEILMSEEGIHQ